MSPGTDKVGINSFMLLCCRLRFLLCTNKVFLCEGAFAAYMQDVHYYPSGMSFIICLGSVDILAFAAMMFTIHPELSVPLKVNTICRHQINFSSS